MNRSGASTTPSKLLLVWSGSSTTPSKLLLVRSGASTTHNKLLINRSGAIFILVAGSTSFSIQMVFILDKKIKSSI